MKSLAALIAFFMLAVLLTGPAQAGPKVSNISTQPKFTNASTPTTARLNCVKGQHYKKVSLTVRSVIGESAIVPHGR